MGAELRACVWGLVQVHFFTRAGYRSAVHDGPARWVEQRAGLGRRLLSEFE